MIWKNKYVNIITTWIIEKFFHAKNFSLSTRRSFFMAKYDEIEFLESEILEDDVDAPVGTLIHVAEDGTVEEAKPIEDAVSTDEEKTENNEIISKDSENVNDTVENEELNGESVSAPQETVADEITAEESEETATQNDTTVENVSEEDIDQESAIENTALEDEKENETAPEENVEEVASDQTEDVSAESSAEYEPVPVISVDMTEEEKVNSEQASEVNAEETQEEDNSAVEEIKDATTEENAETSVEEKTEEIKVEKPKKARKPAQKRIAEKQEENEDKHGEKKSAVKLDDVYSVDGALHNTNFAIEQPKKAKVVSTKQKQEKAEDLWAVASVVPKKKIAKNEPKAEEPKKEEVTPATKKRTTKQAVNEDRTVEVAADTTKKKSAAKKSTQVENTQNSTTEEKKKVAAKDKTATTAEKDVKATKTTAKADAKTAKETKAPEKEAIPAKEVKETKTAKDDNNDEQVLVEGEGKIHGKYVIKKTDKGNFVFKLYSSNYRVVAIGAQAYTTLGAAKIGVQSIIKNAEIAPVENQTLKNYETLKFPKWEIYQDKKGEYRLRLFATNGSLIATTNDGYADITGAKNGIAAVARASKGCAIVRNDNLW